jgi:hypothetical protein
MYAIPDNKNTWEVDHFYVLTVTEVCTLLQDSLWAANWNKKIAIV